MFKAVLSSLRKNLVAGILVFVPVAVTVWFVYFAWELINRPLVALFDWLLGEAAGPLTTPGVGLFVIMAAIYLLGLIARSFVGRWIVNVTDAVLERLPVIRTVYKALKQILGAIFSGGEGRFRDVVLFEYPRKGIYSIGFVTSATLGEPQEKTQEQMVNVFLPTTPNPTSGFLLLVPRTQVRYLSMSSEEAVRFIISGGMVQPQAADLDAADSIEATASATAGEAFPPQAAVEPDGDPRSKRGGAWRLRPDHAGHGHTGPAPGERAKGGEGESPGPEGPAGPPDGKLGPAADEGPRDGKGELPCGE
jgi:uncharacterized membrane protein